MLQDDKGMISETGEAAGAPEELSNKTLSQNEEGEEKETWAEAGGINFGWTGGRWCRQTA